MAEVLQARDIQPSVEVGDSESTTSVEIPTPRSESPVLPTFSDLHNVTPSPVSHLRPAPGSQQNEDTGVSVLGEVEGI
jgi:hypothetical protein